MNKLSTRIVYIKKQDNVFVSKKRFLTTKDIVEVYLNKDDLSFWIATNQGQVIKKGNGKTLAEVKKSAKAVLKSLGAHFENECRNRILKKKVKNESK